MRALGRHGRGASRDRPSAPGSVAVLAMLLAGLLVVGCTTTSGAAAADDSATITISRAPADDAAPAGITRAELDDRLRRFADQYITRTSIAVDTMRGMEISDAARAMLQAWFTVSYATAVDLAIGPDSVTNLLDYLVLTRLGRLVVEDHWIPEVFGEVTGEPLRSAALALEREAWSLADEVLTPQQQAQLASLIDDWHREHPDQVYAWGIRMDEFSGQRAANVNRVKATGGLLREVRSTRETAEEIQAFGERVLYYMQRAPAITGNTVETSTLQLLSSPPVLDLMDKLERFVTTLEEVGETVEGLPASRLAAVDQVLQGVDKQREALMSEVGAATPEATAALVELRRSLEAVERMLPVLGPLLDTAGESEPLDMAEVRSLAQDAAGVASEFKSLADSLHAIITDLPQATAVLEELSAAQRSITNYAVGALLVLIAAFFVMLLAYRLVAARLLRR
jgi:hypothetical protein